MNDQDKTKEQLIDELNEMRQMFTEHKRMEEALRLLEERFSKAFNASPSTMAITSLKDGRFIDVNDNFCHVVGFPRKEIIGQTSLEIGFWLDRTDRELILQSINNNNPVQNMEIIFCRRKVEVQ